MIIVEVLHQCFRDVRVGARLLAKSPLFTFFAAFILAMAIGANITVFSFLTAILARPLAIPQPDRLVRLYSLNSGNGNMTRIGDYDEYRNQSQSLASIGGYNNLAWFGPIRIGSASALPMDEFLVTLVTGRLFETIGLPAHIGRSLTAEDAIPGAPLVAVLSDECWRRYFGRDPDVLGRSVFIAQEPQPFTIVGVMPPAFSDVFRVSPDGLDLSNLGADILKGPLLFAPWYKPDPTGYVSLIARLKPQFARSDAQADLSRIASQLSNGSGRDVSISVAAGNAVNPIVETIFAVFAALFIAVVAIVLMIACDDIAILLLARIAGRRHEIAVRMALGASRSQLIRQLVAENVVLSVLAGVGAMIVALATARVIESLQLPLALPDSSHLTFDWRVVAFASVLSLSTTIFFGIRPALHGVQKDVALSLNSGSSSHGSASSTVRSQLVIAQITVCTAMLITAAVLVRSLGAAGLAEQSTATKKIVMTRFTFQGTPYDRGNAREFYDKLLSRLEGAPGIVSASAAAVTPIPEVGGSTLGTGVVIVLGNRSNDQFEIQTNSVTPGFFKTLGIPLLDGRDFTPADPAGGRAVCIINQTAQRLVFPDENPIGHLLRLSDGSSIQVVGVSRDIKYTKDQTISPLVYRPLAQNPRFFRGVLMVRGSGDIAETSSRVHAKIIEVNPTILAKFRPMEDEIRLVLLPSHVGMYLVGVPGLLALMLGLIGTYGTMSLLVAHRRVEIGVRIALGARPAEAVRLMLRQGLRWTAIGLLLGIVGASIMTFAMSRFFYGLSPFDLTTFVFTLIPITLTATAACYIPAKLASRLDPMQVLRQE